MSVRAVRDNQLRWFSLNVSVSVRSADLAEDAEERWDTFLPPWAEFDGEAAANAAVEAYFDAKKWDEWFGEARTARLIATIYCPGKIAGTYSSRLMRTTKSFAREM